MKQPTVRRKLFDRVEKVVYEFNEKYNLDSFGGYAHISWGVHLPGKATYRVRYGKKGGKSRHGYCKDLESEDKLASLLRKIDKPAALCNGYKYMGQDPIESYLREDVSVTIVLREKRPDKTHWIQRSFQKKRISFLKGEELWISPADKQIPKGNGISGLSVGQDHDDNVYLTIYYKKPSETRLVESLSDFLFLKYKA